MENVEFIISQFSFLFQFPPFSIAGSLMIERIGRVRIFVTEYLVSGALFGSVVSSSMRREGLLMLTAVAEDILRLPGYSVVTSLEPGLSLPPEIEVVRCRGAAEEASAFRGILDEVDAVLVIAPETDGVLASRCRIVNEAGVASWNCSVAAIELCGDKLQLARYLKSRNIPTIPTTAVDLTRPPPIESLPVVLKPRDGAGSCLTFLVRNQNEWEHAVRLFQSESASENCVMQPFVTGQALSVAVNISFDGASIECLPIAEQHLSDDGRFQYLGGAIPACIRVAAGDRIRQMVFAICHSIPGLAGYVGIDVLLTSAGEPVIVEINPRLTTSYVGYRQLCSGLLPQQWIGSKDKVSKDIWNSDSIEF